MFFDATKIVRYIVLNFLQKNPLLVATYFSLRKVIQRNRCHFKKREEITPIVKFWNIFVSYT